MMLSFLAVVVAVVNDYLELALLILANVTGYNLRNAQFILTRQLKEMYPTS